jgi:propionate catabolism operon transcriptional regulator
MQSPYKIAVLSYLEEIKEIMKSFAFKKEYHLDYFPIKYGRNDLGAQDLLDRGYEVILVHSTFARKAVESHAYSTISIPKTDTDVIRTLLKASKISSKIVMPLEQTETIDVQLIEKLCDVEVTVLRYADIVELQKKLLIALEEDSKVVVGGGFSETLVLQFENSTYFPVRPSISSFDAALKHAQIVARAKRNDQKRLEELISIFKVFEDGILYINEFHECVYMNKSARIILNLQKPINKKINIEKYYDILEIDCVMSGKEYQKENIIRVNEKEIIVNVLTVTTSKKIGAVVILRDIHSLRNITGRIRASEQKKHGFIANISVDDIRGESVEIRQLKKMINTYAPHDSPVLIHGETGTGKDMTAQAIHLASKRSAGPFVAINCAALPDTLLESELFGYEEGAFTGARKGGKAGVFEMAHTGTLFLDEIGDLDYNAQLRLLRVLESKQLIRVGGNQVIPVNVRIISASHKKLSDLVRDSTFRSDLFYRLAVLRISIPPLRDRLEDITLLLKDIFTNCGKKSYCLTSKMKRMLGSHSWPGNVRELRSLVESYLILLGDEDYDERLFTDLFMERMKDIETNDSAPRIENKKQSADRNVEITESFEDFKTQVNHAKQRIVQKAVAAHFGNKRLAAKQLNISYNTLWRILPRKE